MCACKKQQKAITKSYCKRRICRVLGVPEERHYQHSGVQPLRENR